jgi:signal transduction histidine kinase
MGTGTADDPIRVLLVDDDRDDFILTRDILQDIPGRHYTLDWTSGYAESLEAICRGDHDVYLIDYRLGERDGLSLWREALDRNCTGPMILLTGVGEMELDLAAMQAGAAGYLEKAHLEPVRLERSIRYACQKKRDEAELEQKVAERTRELEQEIAVRRRAEEALRLADRRKDEFLATLAHELRNPLVPIRNALGILQLPGGTTKTQQSALEVLNRQIAVMVRLINDLLEMARIARGKLQLDCEPLSLSDVLQAALEVSQPLLDRANVTLTTRIPNDLPALVGDRIRLAQVFANLLNNAAKYTERGGKAELTVTREGKQIVVRVRDTGVGIPADLLPHIFEMFSQVDRSLDRSQGGLGIGLALVRNLIELHGGTVSAHSDGPGTGTEITVYLPIPVPGQETQVGG